MAKFNELINGDTPVLVDFHAEWCGPCKMMAPVIKQLSEETSGKAKILKVDVDKNPKAARKYGIQGVPTFMLFKNGKVLWKQAGVIPLQVMKDVIAKNA